MVVADAGTRVPVYSTDRPLRSARSGWTRLDTLRLWRKAAARCRFHACPLRERDDGPPACGRTHRVL